MKGGETVCRNSNLEKLRGLGERVSAEILMKIDF